MASKKPSGAEYKRRKKAKIEANQHSVRQLQNWLEKPSSSDISSSLKTRPGEPQEKTIEFGENTIIESQEKGREVEEEEIEFGNSIEQEKDAFISINFNDPPSWPPITDKIRCVIIEHGPEQGEDTNFKESASEDGRRFSKHWFSKKCSNGERVHRNWLLFSKISRSIFCFPCILFGKGGKSDSAICNQSQGFKDWKNLNRISDHENSAFHRDAYLHWKCFEKKLKTGGFIDDSLQKAIQSEKERWRNILRVVLDVILFCAQNNLPLRGTEEIIGNPNAGMFLKLIELISRYNMTIAEHVANHKKGSVSYLSNKIQDEFLLLLGKHVRNEILSRIKESKYFSLIFDCTPDLSHHEQMCQIIRYVIIRNDSITIEESFIDFIATKEKTGIGLACEIVNKLEKDGLDILNVRGQGYDNGANMAGVYNGVQAIISQNNERAIYIPCAAHSLNLVCKNAVSSNANMITFFGIVQRIYTFFVNSTTRWDKLMSVLKTTLKGHTDTRWASRQNAIKELHQHIPQVYKILIDLKNEQPLQCAEIQIILKQINFKFLCTLSTWNLILQEVDNISKALQSKTMTIFKASRLIEGLSNSLQQMRDTIWENIFSKSENLALEMELSTDFEQKRRKFIILDDQSQQTVPYNCKYLFTVEMKEVIDILISQLRWRYEKLYGISSDFEFLSGEKLESMDTENLKKAACDLSRKYPNDLNSVEILSEISSFKNQAMTLIPDLKAATCLDILKTIHEYSLVQSYPNLEVALRIFLTLPVTVASGERSFSKLKIIKTYLRSSLAQEKLSNMAILSIEQEFANQINFDQIIDEFALVKARKVKL